MEGKERGLMLACVISGTLFWVMGYEGARTAEALAEFINNEGGTSVKIAAVPSDVVVLTSDNFNEIVLDEAKDVLNGSNDWASPPGKLFSLRGPNYFAKKSKVLTDDWSLNPTRVDWQRSNSKLDHVLSRPDNRVMAGLRSSKTPKKSSKTFILAVNLQVPGRDHHSAHFANPPPPVYLSSVEPQSLSVSLPPSSSSPTRTLLLSMVVTDVSESTVRRELEMFSDVRGVQMEKLREGMAYPFNAYPPSSVSSTG
ncbi:protein of unknown function-containing protein [Forsythia ovata]|uniref:Protein ENHANCED DISEASE RESISTANCE 2 C-terminal domain-containing protein n=1 Tax=Forsythia ovata TaxID=205694 RepID=A0ABD1U6R0_9LAMI